MEGLRRVADAWTASSTWWVFVLFSALGAAALALRGGRFLGRAVSGDADARRALAAASALLAASLALRWLVPEGVHYTFNDEYEYVAAARTLVASHRYALPSGPPAGIFVWALAFLPFGTATGVVFATTIVVASLTPPALLWMLRVLRVDRTVALVAAALLALAPLHVKHAASASLEVLSLLFVVLTIGTFVELLRAPGAVASACFAASLFFALTVRVENWALVALLPLVWWLWRSEVRVPSPAWLALPAASFVLAAAYLPGILAAPIRYEPWWKSQLPAGSLLATNLAFWFGGDLWTRKVPLLLAGVGLVAGLRANARAMLLWLAFLLLYSVVYVLYGLNVGWLEEAHQPPPWGARGAGHDMFRFNVVLLAPVVLLLAYGLAALARGAASALRAAPPGAPRRPLGVAGLAGAVVLLVLLLAWRDEYATYHPLQFLESPYNRGYEIAEFRFLRDATAGVAPGARLYLAPPAAGIALGGVETRPLAALEVDVGRDAAAGVALLYVSGRQLGVPGVRARIEALRRRHDLQEVTRRRVGRDVFQLFVVRPRTSATAR